MRKLGLVAAGTLQIYMERHVSRAAAALSYFLMLTIFPLLVCLQEMLGGLIPEYMRGDDLWKTILPGEMQETFLSYLDYITDHRSPEMLPVALFSMASSSAAAFRIIDHIMGEIRGNRRFSGPFAVVFSFGFSLIFLAAVYFSAVVMISGGWFLRYVDAHIPWINIRESWRWMRFLLLFLLLFVIILGIYRLTAPRKEGLRLFTGAAVASCLLLLVSILFSYFIDMSVKYSLIYGSLASVMILLLWLYLCGSIVIGGNILNVVLERV